MSFFMLSMPVSFLMSSPPVSKQTPLPTSVILGASSLPQVMSIRRGARGEPAPTAATSGKFFASASPAVTSIFAPCCLASARAACSSSAGPMSFDGVLMRSRASVTPSTMRLRSSPSTPSGTTKPRLARLRLAVAGELIGVEREGERGEPRVMRRVGEAVGARRQQSGQLPRAEQVFHRLVRIFQAEQHAGEFAVRRRHDQMAPGLGLVAGGADERALAVVDDLDRLVERGGGDEQDRRRGFAGFRENRMHGHSAASRIGEISAHSRRASAAASSPAFSRRPACAAPARCRRRW